MIQSRECLPEANSEAGVMVWLLWKHRVDVQPCRPGCGDGRLGREPGPTLARPAGGVGAGAAAS